MRNVQKMEVWRRAHGLVLRTYDVTETLPEHERLVIVPQARRAAGSVPANISEGSGLHTDRQFAHHLSHSSGSAAELEYWFHLAHDLGYIPRPTFIHLRDETEEIRRQLYAFARHLRTAAKRRK